MPPSRRLFGTDGVRGVANRDLTPELALALGGAFGERLPGGAWVIGGWTLHPLVLMFALSGTLMISKTLRIPKL